MKNIYIAIHTGLEVRNLLRLGAMQRLLENRDLRVVLITPAWQNRSFLNEFASERVIVEALRMPRVSALYETRLSRAQAYSLRLYRWVRRLPFPRAAAYGLQEIVFPSDLYDPVFDRFPPALVTVNPRQPEDIPLVLNARRRRVPTLGLVQSWDNVIKGLPTRADRLAVWNPINRDEAIQLDGYSADQVSVIGPLQFDPYFAPDTVIDRERFLRSLGLDPERKIILFPTSATQLIGDQVFVLDTLIQAGREGEFAEPIQVVCRPYPRDWLGPYVHYLHKRDIYLDLIPEWNAILETMMGLDQVRHVANLLAHTDVMLNFATTMTLEAAVFDTPTILLAYTEGGDKEQMRDYIENWHLGKHFRPIVERGLVPVVRSRSDLIAWINRYLKNPALYREQRKQIVANWVCYTDGRSADRLVDLMLDLARGVLRD